MQDLAAYFYQHVFLAYHHYAEVKNDQVMGDNRDRREAINAGAALYHLREHIPAPFRKSRAKLAAKCPDYDLLGDIVNAAKHKQLTRGTPQVVRADEIYEIMVCTKYQDDQGEYEHCEKVVEVKLIDGSTRDIYVVLTNVVNMWFEELHQIGAIEERRPLESRKQEIVLRDSATSIDLSITKGIQWKQRMGFQRFNFETNEVEPVGLSDYEEIVFTVREPQTFELQLHDEAGLGVTTDVTLTPEQLRMLRAMGNQKEQDEYLWQIALDKGIVAQMLSEHFIAKRDEKK